MKYLADVINNNDLVFFPFFIKKKFSIWFKTVWEDCLIAQLTYVLSSVTKIPTWVFKNAIDRSNRLTAVQSHKGITLDHALAFFEENTICWKKTKYKLTISTDIISSVVECVENIERGIPTLLISDTYSSMNTAMYMMETNSTYLSHVPSLINEGIVPKSYIKKMRSINYKNKNCFFHVFCVIGYDKINDHLILRDVSSEFLFNGYAKIPATELSKVFNSIRMIKICVDDIAVVS